MKIESKDIDVERLFDGHFFNIPRFQRPYSWDADNIQDLWNDVTSSRGEDYFIGSMVVYREDKHLLNIVDGQQRLTTLTLFLCAIRDELAKHDSDLAAGVHQLIERKNRINRSEFVLKTETSYPYLQDEILSFDDPQLDHISPTPEEQNLYSANETIRSHIKNALKAIDDDPTIPEHSKADEKLSRLVDLRDGIQNLKVILVELENEDDAYLIFETLNTRGKDLSVTDLLKNHFTKTLRKKGDVDAVKEKWQATLNELHESSADLDMDSFLYHYWASRHDAIPLKKLYPAMKKEVGPQNAMPHLNSIRQDSRLYRAIHEPSILETNLREVANSLAAIQLFRVSQPAPALLSLLRAYDKKIIKPRLLLRAVRAIENFHFTFTAITSSRSSGGISSMYSSFARKLFNAEDPNTAAMHIAEFTKKLEERRPSFAEFEVAFSEVRFMNNYTKQKSLVRYILRKFAENEAYKFPVDWSELTIEHFQPQDSVGTDGWTADEVGQLGNLFYLDPVMNPRLGNKNPSEKRTLLLADRYDFPEPMHIPTGWSREAITLHTQAMARKAYDEIWAL